jgi:phosphatidylcholine synthase
VASLSRQRILAWLVHLYTASGAALSAWAVIAVIARDFRLAWLLIAVTIAIDSTDGFLARRFQVKKVLPGIDGRRLDDIVDYLCWVFVPIIILMALGSLPAWAAAAPLIASGYGFAQADAKTPDNYFLGFPSYWSLVALYLYLFNAPPLVTTSLILLLSVLVFVPFRYPYPTQMAILRLPTLLLGVPWAILGFVLILLTAPPRWLVLLFCYYPLYYLLLTIYLAWQRRTTERSVQSA